MPLWISATFVPMSHTCFQNLQPAWKPQYVTLGPMLPWATRMQAHPPPNIFLPFLLLSGFLILRSACAPAAPTSLPLLRILHAAGFLPSSPAHSACRGPHSASRPPVNSRETAGSSRSSFLSLSSWGSRRLGLSCGQPLPQCVPANRGPLDWQQWSWHLSLNTEFNVFLN